ncbi:MAG: inorganic phosphate transporter [Pseudorhodobacter sp.]
MAQTPINHWKALDKDLGRISRLELATQYISRGLVAPGLGLAFIAFVAISAAVFSGGSPDRLIVIAAAAFGAYMALNIGANDVANNMGPAVGANALSLGGAIAIAAVFETAGALIAGGEVVSTISKGIVQPESLTDRSIFIWAMMAALIAAALWINLATWIGAPVSTTHSVVGGVMGAGVAAAGLGAVNWPTMSQIAASWVISPMMGGVIAAIFLAFIKARVEDAEDKIGAARRWVPILIGIMAGAFSAYLALKGLSKVVKVPLPTAIMLGAGLGLAGWLMAIPLIRRQSEGLENRKKSLKKLFGLPLVVSAALLSFAHGANDVANAVGPLAAIVHAIQDGSVDASVTIPLWVMVVGAAGISFGLILFGPKLIRMVGSEITKLNPVRAFCVALSAALTVILASALGLPVSSTHIAVGAIFGVGFYREWQAERRARLIGMQKGKQIAPEERRRRKLVRRSHFLTIAAAWVVTVPAAAVLAGGIFLVLENLL